MEQLSTRKRDLNDKCLLPIIDFIFSKADFACPSLMFISLSSRQFHDSVAAPILEMFYLFQFLSIQMNIAFGSIAIRLFGEYHYLCFLADNLHSKMFASNIQFILKCL